MDRIYYGPDPQECFGPVGRQIFTYVSTFNFSDFWGKFGVFQVFFLILGANPCFWVKNGGWCVSLRGMGNIGNKKTSIN